MILVGVSRRSILPRFPASRIFDLMKPTSAVMDRLFDVRRNRISILDLKFRFRHTSSNSRVIPPRGFQIRVSYLPPKLPPGFNSTLISNREGYCLCFSFYRGFLRDRHKAPLVRQLLHKFDTVPLRAA